LQNFKQRIQRDLEVDGVRRLAVLRGREVDGIG
jgi:hypothetical protein